MESMTAEVLAAGQAGVTAVSSSLSCWAERKGGRGSGQGGH